MEATPHIAAVKINNRVRRVELKVQVKSIIAVIRSINIAYKLIIWIKVEVQIIVIVVSIAVTIIISKTSENIKKYQVTTNK